MTLECRVKKRVLMSCGKASKTSMVIRVGSRGISVEYQIAEVADSERTDIRRSQTDQSIDIAQYPPPNNQGFVLNLPF